MLDLDRQLRDYGGYLDELEPEALPVAATERNRWRSLAAAALVAVLIAGAAALAGHRESNHRVKTVGAAHTSSSTPSATTAPAIVRSHPTYAQQIAQLGQWYKGAQAEAPGGRPMLEAEAEFCDYRSQHADLGNMGVQQMFASFFPLAQPLTDARIVDGCLRHDPDAAPIETPVGDLPAYQLCSTNVRGPNYDPDTKATNPVVRPVVAFGARDCAAAGYEALPSGLLDELNGRRRVEIEMRAVPAACPTEQEASAWAQAVTARELGHAWPMAGQLATEPRQPNRCFRPTLIDWDLQRVVLGQF